RVQPRKGVRRRERDVIGQMPVTFLRHPDRRYAETEKTGIVSGQLRFDVRIIGEIPEHDFTQLRLLLAGRAAPDREHGFDPGIKQAFPQHPLSDHSGGAEQDDLHRSQPRAGWKRRTAAMMTMTKSTR